MDQFLAELAILGEILLFTASEQEYADRVISFLDPGHVISHAYYREVA